jgi:hypothetical protein
MKIDLRVAYGKCRRCGNPLESADSHSDLEKTFGFSTFPTGPAGLYFDCLDSLR